MARLDTYTQYDGVNPYTGSIRNALDYSGVRAPHTGEPFSEAFLLGISGGIAFGYFVFQYEGVPPQVNLLTRNTFNTYGWDAITSRLGLVQDVRQSVKADRAQQNLIETLEQGLAPIVWADVFSLGYERSDLGDGMWMMQPMVVSDFDPDRNRVVVADRSRKALVLDADRFNEARARVKKDKFRFVTLDLPEVPDLTVAVTEGLRDCVGLFFEKPPRGSANNFGFTAYGRWQTFLTRETGKGSWAADLADGPALFAALTSAFTYGLLHWKDDSQSGDRVQFAEFLDEAAIVLSAPALNECAVDMRAIADLWGRLGSALLPAEVPALNRARELLVEKHDGFLNDGLDFRGRSAVIDGTWGELAEEAAAALSDPALVNQLKAGIARQVGEIASAERGVMDRLREIVS